MTRDEHLMSIGMEECAEVAQRLSKALRFGLAQVQPSSSADGLHPAGGNPSGLSNCQRVQEEFADLVAVLEMLDPQLTHVTAMQIAAKREKVEKYLRLSERCGTLDPPRPPQDTRGTDSESRKSE